MSSVELEHAVVLVTGVQAAGKSTVAQGLAERLPRAVHVRGDAFRRMVVSGRAEMTPVPSDEALRQLRVRYRLTAAVADGWFEAGFTAVVQDVILGDELVAMVEAIRSRPLHLVVLAPTAAAVAAREAGRGKVAYGAFTVDELDAVLRLHTPRLGLWLDTSQQTPAETVTEILARVGPASLIP